MHKASDPFLAQWARTQQFSLGVPRAVVVSPDGRRVVFCRTRSGRDPVSCLWVFDVDLATERLLVDPTSLPGTDAPQPPEELTRRERTRERSSGITRYATDSSVRSAAFTISGRLWTVDVQTGQLRELRGTGPAVDPRPDPTGSTVAYASGGAIHVIDADGHHDMTLATPELATVTYGLAEHVAMESMGRERGYWWAPDGRRLIAARVDTAPVQRWHLADPASPGKRPAAIPYPAAGTANALVTLDILSLDGGRVAVEWERPAYEYVVSVDWRPTGLLIAVQNRAQTSLRVLAVDPETGRTRTVRDDRDPKWVSIVPGVPAQNDRGELVWVADHENTRRLLVGNTPVTPPGLQVRSVVGVASTAVYFIASTHQGEDHVWVYTPAAGCSALTTTPGLHSAAVGGDTQVITARTRDAPRVRVRRASGPDVEIRSLRERPMLDPQPRFIQAGDCAIPVAVLFPDGHVPGVRLPVLMDPYGGPAGRRVVADNAAYLLAQWWANQGYAVVIADGAGTPGRDPAWERLVHLDVADIALADQVIALHAAAEAFPDLDLDRVGIRGWSYGGFLAALAVLRRPDVFHAAVAGAPVTDQRLYDTHYQERYLGLPADRPSEYERSSLLADAANLRRPLLLIHGMLDDNVLPVHSFRLSAALLAAGRHHEFVVLPGASHTPTDVNTVIKLLERQAEFLHRSIQKPH